MSDPTPLIEEMQGISHLATGVLRTYLTATDLTRAKYNQARVADPPLGIREPDYLHETWGRLPPRTGAQVVVRRPALREGWQARFGFTITDDRVQEADVRLALEQGGVLVGLGSWRPRYGRFRITTWEVR